MECNKEEAVRAAMQLLESKKEDSDFTGALEMAQKACRLFPDRKSIPGLLESQKALQGIPRLLEKCEVLYLLFEADPPELNGEHHRTSSSRRQGLSDTRLNQHEQEEPDTFLTCCPVCKVKCKYYIIYANQSLVCPACQTTFLPRDLSIEGVHPEPSAYQFENGNPSVRRFENENAALGPVSKAGIFADGRGPSSTVVGVGKESIGISKSGENCKIGNRARDHSKQVIIEEKDGSPNELNEGLHCRRSSRKRQLICYSENQNDKYDFVSPPKSSRDSHMSSATEKERKNAAVVDGGIFKKDRSTDSAAASLDRYKKKPKRKESASLEERFPSKKRKTGGSELQVKEAAMPENNESEFKDDVGSGPNSKIASMPNMVEVPYTEYSKFGLDEDWLENIFSANQIWALYDPVDGMPRFYACIEKVFSPGFKLKITWLEPDPDGGGEIAWCKKELPVACGRYTLGHTEEVTDHLMFSHQMHCIKLSGRNSFLVYPRKGETWALYHNWDIGWSSEPEKHLPFKFEYVEVVSDFAANYGMGVAYLGKVIGSVSLFQRSEQHENALFQVPPNELYRFSHRIPSFKMTGDEGDGVPKGSFELDTASLPTKLDDFSDQDDLEMDSQSLKAETDGSFSELQKSAGRTTSLNPEECYQKIKPR